MPYIDWVKIDRESLGKRVDAYKSQNDTSGITIPIYDFFVMLDALRDVCDEWGASSRVQEIVYPVYEKYMDMNNE